ncbi:MAG TPA: M36 family metallopeptidase, partial [Actinomycetota bacterium]|nr:M36 family metallopeptidase [Actinomycetota bacterium]
GHATQDAQVPGWGQASEGGAMGEGFGDFLAGAYFARSISKGFQDACIGDWDATTYSDDDPPCLRRLDGKKVYPEDMVGQVHADGEIWSAFLWKVRAALASDERQRTDDVLRLVLTSHEFLDPDATFVDGVVALLRAADALGHPEWVAHIESAAQTHGLPTSDKVDD